MKRRRLVLLVLGLILLSINSYPVRSFYAKRLIIRASNELFTYELGLSERHLLLAYILTPLNREPARKLRLFTPLLTDLSGEERLITELEHTPGLDLQLVDRRQTRLTEARNTIDPAKAFALAESALHDRQPLLTIDLLERFAAQGENARDYWRLKGDAQLLLHKAAHSSRLLRQSSVPERLTEAIKSYEQALALDITNQSLINQLTPLYLNTHQPDKAELLEKR